MALLALASSPAIARQSAPASVAPATTPADHVTPDLLLSLGLSENRMTVPVSIGAAGPWPFVIDTGSERTVVSRELAARLGLEAGPALRVVAMTGVAPTASVVVPSLKISLLTPALGGATITAPALDGRNIGAPGILGIDALQGQRVEIDFDRSAMTVHPSRKHYVASGAHGDEIVVIARSLFGQLIVTDGSWRGRKIAVVIDTGSTMTVGNPALLALMAGRTRALGATEALSVTGALLRADSGCRQAAFPAAFNMSWQRSLPAHEVPS